MSAEEFKRIFEDEGKQWNVSSEVHPEDYIFQFLFENPSFVSKDKAIEYYFRDGLSSAQKLRTILNDICDYSDDRKISLLEFASGYGCVTRHFKNIIPFSETTSCDIHPQAIRFIKEKLGINSILSASKPEEFNPNQRYDAVFALSFFSHMPKNSFGRWLKTLMSLVKPKGYLIFTTHGFESIKFIPKCHFDADGFYFQATSEQKDIATSEYGLTCTQPKYVFSQVFQNVNTTLKFFREGFWWNHQDVFVVKCK
jgi:2-polyprenyl-3-methyl-5-hydroxy-6-metoxy-1,4-benzoquinol methylase